MEPPRGRAEGQTLATVVAPALPKSDTGFPPSAGIALPRAGHAACMTDDLLAELLRLRRGRGLHEPHLAVRLGPELRTLCSVLLGDADGPARAKVMATLGALAGQLSPDLRRAAELALAMGERPASRLSRRAEDLAAILHCSERTARRRMDEALALIAGAATRAGEAPPGPAWRVRRFTALLRLDTPSPELYETRTIYAERHLDSVTVTLDVPARADTDEAAGPLEVEAVRGARVSGIETGPDGRHHRVTVQLGRRLCPAERLSFTLRYRLPPGARIREHCVLVPLHPCDTALIRVRFAAPPSVAWRVDEVAPRQLDAATGACTATRLTPDRVGEIEAQFGRLVQGHAYGVAWRAVQ
ncbi:hypothetical protein Acy02nite_34510 [Actinoplanes cyaneus]|uniref:Uncharacterized protein n=2 Tax=Actinoplanes cyaneus TaxID=52696 RepID=A0A919M0W6_9ACTN|nr:hypothetical protein [Actinoplanes cyaneus]GID65570.1 hypothetical protein Acy02nite_34510 [Actinoplanes cyaneus]